MSESESVSIKYQDFLNQLMASVGLSGKENPELVIEMPGGECLEIQEITWDRKEDVILIQVAD